MNTFAIFSAFLQGLGIVAISMRLYEMAVAQCASKRCERTAASLTFVAGVIVSMGFPLNFSPGVVFDLRHVFLVMAASYGGVPAALLTAAAASGFRLMDGGIGLVSGLVGIGISTTIGLGLASLHKQRELSLLRLGLLGLAASLSLISVFLLPWSAATDIFQNIAAPFIAINLFGVIIAGETLNKFRKQVVREKALVRDTATDPLTGLANRRAFDVNGPEMARAEVEKGNRYAIMIVDVDNFKSINDTFGHANGDRVLCQICDIISANARGADLVARYGGEEIVLVLPGCDDAGTGSVADRIRSGVETGVFELQGIRLKVTVSIGYIVNADPMLSFQGAFDEADAALYRAKNAGRNRIEKALAA
ncbi:GGDEF domain-containing protein [Oricola nitratireducens]|uniref:GGDEF domain-containing protein n=1 Tax=Oricola nitratireducens TaxID=2775868 RepID=UPI001865ADD4|nr:GGDEF domain-containing protein [Oricola nitratireducens]